MENHFSRTMMTKSVEELKSIVNSGNDYNEDAVLAARWELERREHIAIEEVAESIEELKQESVKAETANKPKVFSEIFLVVFGVLFSVVGSGILIAINLLQIKRRQQAVFALLFSVTFVVIQGVVLASIGSVATFISIPTSILGVILIQRLIWEREYPKGLPVVKRSPWLALAIGIAVTGLLMYLFFLVYGFIPGTIPVAK